MALSFPILSVPVAYGLAMVPYFAKVGVITRATGRFENGNEKGRPNLSDYDGKIPKSTLALAQRCTGAHTNALESLIFYASGVAVAVASKVPPAALTKLCVGYLLSRTAFTIVYCAPPIANGVPRTLCFFGSVAFASAIWIQAAKFAVL